VTTRQTQKRIHHRWLIFVKPTILTGILTLTACTHHHTASLFPDGEDWLGWSEFEREEYVSAYVEGMSEGFRNGCETALEATLPPAEGQRFLDANARCAEHAPLQGRDLGLLIPPITLFFQKYPEHRKQRNLGVSIILLKLDQGKTVEDIHAEFSPRH
jgi:hypothetical protein